jgi:hypothetical protein
LLVQVGLRYTLAGSGARLLRCCQHVHNSWGKPGKLVAVPLNGHVCGLLALTPNEC